jgi:hypothetical protein
MAREPRAESGGFDAALPTSAAKRLAWRPSTARASHSFLASATSAQRFGAGIVAGLEQLHHDITGRRMIVAAARPMIAIPRRVERDPFRQIDPHAALATLGASVPVAAGELPHPQASPRYERDISSFAESSLPRRHQPVEQMPTHDSSIVASKSTRRAKEITHQPIAMESGPIRRSPKGPETAEISPAAPVSFSATSREREPPRDKAFADPPVTPPTSATSGWAGLVPEQSSGVANWRPVSAFVRIVDAPRQGPSGHRRDAVAVPFARERQLVASGLTDPARAWNTTPLDGSDVRLEGRVLSDTADRTTEPTSAIAKLIERTVQPEPLPDLRFRRLPRPGEAIADELPRIPVVEPEARRSADTSPPGREGHEDVKRTEPKHVDSPLRRLPAVPQIDIGAVAEKVFHILQRRQRFEHERRGRY